MNNQNLVICENKILYEIFSEIKDYLKFELQFLSEKEISEIVSKNQENYIILSDHNINNIDNQLIIDQFPCEIQKIIEKINLAFLKKNLMNNLK